MLLYEHFNQTLWQRIEREGKDFYDDLTNFRRMKQELKSKCFEDKPSKQLMYGNKYAKGFTLMSDLSSDLIQKCERTTRTEDNYLVSLRNKRVAKLVGIQHQMRMIKKKLVGTQGAIINMFLYKVAKRLSMQVIYFAYFVVKLNYLYGYLENPRTHRECLCGSDVKTFQNRKSN